MKIDESIEKILGTNDIVSGRFYDRFFLECPHLKTYFEGVNMTHQATMLTSAIVLVEMFHSKKASGLRPYMQLLGKQHEERGISKDDFADWSQSMLGTLREFHGDEWDSNLETEWRAALQGAIDAMHSGYK